MHNPDRLICNSTVLLGARTNLLLKVRYYYRRLHIAHRALPKLHCQPQVGALAHRQQSKPLNSLPLVTWRQLLHMSAKGGYESTGKLLQESFSESNRQHDFLVTECQLLLAREAEAGRQ